MLEFGETKRMELPCQICETEKLEAFLEEQARKGWFVRRFAAFCQEAVFEEGEPETVHYWIGLYRTVLDKRELGSAEFSRYRQAAEDWGWEFSFSAQNLAVFQSREKERPPELPGDRGVAYGLLKEATLKQNRRLLLCWSLWGIAWPILLGLGLSLLVWLTQMARADRRFFCLAWIPVIFLLVGNLAVAAAETLQYRKAARLIREEKPLPRRAWFWNRWTLSTLGFVLLIAGILALAWYADTLWKGGLLMAALGLMVFELVWRWRDWRRTGTNCRRGLADAVGIAACLLMLAGVWNLSLPSGYRFHVGKEEALNLTNDPRAELFTAAMMTWAETGLSLEAGETEEYSIKVCWENETIRCEQELVGYDFPKLALPGGDTPRYAGTMAAWLNEKTDPALYLKKKHLTVFGDGIRLAGDFFSYPCEDGKTIVSIQDGGRLVVTHFLSKNDPADLSLEDEKVKTAVESSLVRIAKTQFP